MTNDKTVTMSRELESSEARHEAVKALHDIMQAVSCNSLYSLAEAVFDAGYAAPVVERQEPVARVEIGADRDAVLSITDENWLRSLKARGIHQIAPLYASPPELAELQESLSRARKAHASSQASQNEKIDELQATIARLTADVETMRNKNNELNDTVARLKSESFESLYNDAVDEIERLKAGQGEPVAFWYWPKDCPSDKAFTTNQQLPKDFYEVMPLYTSQPAPVSKQEAATLIASYLAPGRSEGPVNELARAILALVSAPVSVEWQRLKEILEFLDGTGTLDGYAYGDVHVSRRKYWWRTELRAYLDRVKELNQ